MMAWKPWYERAAELQNAAEVEEFMKGVFGQRPKLTQPIVAGLVAGYASGKAAEKLVKKAKKK
jgi:hypothetical protein